MIPARKRVEVWVKVVFVFTLASALLLPEAVAQSLYPSSVQKFVDPLPRVCGVIPTFDGAGNATCLAMTNTPVGGKDYYTIGERQFDQPVLSCSDDNPSPGCTGQLPKTTVWGFGPDTAATDVCGGAITRNCFHYPAATVVATVKKTVQVKWINQLKDSNGDFVTYPPGVPFVQNHHWANPSNSCDPGGRGTDCTGPGGFYFGPVPTVVHLHGIRADSESDGIPEAWNLPAANNIPDGFATHGSDYCQVTAGGARSCAYHNDGAALFEYPNVQYASTLFFHDHTLGATEQNVYMGLVGFYLLAGGPNHHLDAPVDCGNSQTKNNPSCKTGGLPGANFEIPMAIQDKAFNTDGSLFFTSSGNIKVVNGKTWPYVNVEPRKYRLRLVNGSDESFFLLSLTNGLSFTQIGGDSGFLPHPAAVNTLSITPGERADVVVDFSPLDGCTGAECNVTLLDAGASGDAGQVMQFKVGALSAADTSAIPNALPHQAPLCPAGNACETSTRKVALFDHLLGLFQGGNAVSMKWDEPITETVTLGKNGAATTEVWEIHDLKDDHPI
ncbi:MAG TPA: hypothetical protein VHM88_03815, partial [Candidatus Acidoferrales bacterium]|nr:hypothetical protein [Candidatus Acidoferrales bacterium]